MDPLLRFPIHCCAFNPDEGTTFTSPLDPARRVLHRRRFTDPRLEQGRRPAGDEQGGGNRISIQFDFSPTASPLA
ncbi:MAG: hypothetical protein WAW42_08275 [Candidatus Competibacteraceae bacterium]